MHHTLNNILTPIHREGYPFIALFTAVTLASCFFLPDFLTFLCVIATMWCVYFFRDPKRITPLGPSFVIAPADGVISAIEEVIPPPELDLEDEKHLRISIFMNVFDVHVNRSPMDGFIRKMTYVPGKFLNASLDKASLDNERQALTLDIAGNKRLGVVQIAGLVARRIVTFAKVEQTLQAGERFGLIRFGSRVDVYLPPGHGALCLVGQRSVGGETILADLSSSSAPPLGRRS